MNAAAPRPAGLSPLVAGAWRLVEWALPVETLLRWIGERLDLGVTSFDHADLHGDHRIEALFGQALARSPQWRARMQIVARCGLAPSGQARPAPHGGDGDLSPASVRASVEASLAALRTDHLDLLLLHRPDALMDARALADLCGALRREGKVLHFGAAHASPARLDMLHRHLPLVTHQVELSPLHLAPLHDGTLDQAQALGLVPMAWAPLAGGRLFTGSDDAAQRVRRELAALADQTGLPPTTLAMAWVRRHPSRPLPVIGARRVEVIEQALAAHAVELDRSSWWRITAAAGGATVP